MVYSQILIRTKETKYLQIKNIFTVIEVPASRVVRSADPQFNQFYPGGGFGGQFQPSFGSSGSNANAQSQTFNQGFGGLGGGASAANAAAQSQNLNQFGLGGAAGGSGILDTSFLGLPYYRSVFFYN